LIGYPAGSSCEEKGESFYLMLEKIM